jgi:hypothetical protein
MGYFMPDWKWGKWMFIYSFCQICVLRLQCIVLWCSSTLLVTLSLLRLNMLLRICVQISLNYNLLIGETQVKQFWNLKIQVLGLGRQKILNRMVSEISHISFAIFSLWLLRRFFTSTPTLYFQIIYLPALNLHGIYNI